MKRTITMLLSLAIILGLSTIAPKSSAASYIELEKTLYVGNKFVFKNPVKTNGFRSVNSSNKKVATVTLNSKKKITIKAKKKGTALITIKTRQKITYWYTIKVKKRSTTWKAFTPYNEIDANTSRYTGNVMFEVANTSGIYASEASVAYELYGESGNVVFTGSQRLVEVIPGEKIHLFAIANNLAERVESGKVTKITLTQDQNASKYKYTNRNNDLVIKEVENNEDSLRFSITNKSKDNISGTAEVIYYADAAAKHPMGMFTFNLYTNANGSNTVAVPTKKGYVSYKLVKRAYTSKYVGV